MNYGLNIPKPSDYGESGGLVIPDLADKVALVTGGASGIGAEVVRQFAYQGVYVAFLDKDKEKGTGLQDLLIDIGCSAYFIGGDLMKPQDRIDAVVEAVSYSRRMVGEERIDILVNCAGNNDSLACDASAEDITNSLELNLAQYIAMTQLCWEYLSKNNGNIVNISSKTGIYGQGGSWAYSAANGGINTLTKSCAIDGAPLGIRVNCVAPSEVLGEHYQRWADDEAKRQGHGTGDELIAEVAKRIPLGHRMTTEREIAMTVLTYASDMLSGHSTGEVRNPGGGFPELVS